MDVIELPAPGAAVEKSVLVHAVNGRCDGVGVPLLFDSGTDRSEIARCRRGRQRSLARLRAYVFPDDSQAPLALLENSSSSPQLWLAARMRRLANAAIGLSCAAALAPLLYDDRSLREEVR